jgi:hypothetical protein
MLEHCTTEHDPIRIAAHLESALRRKIGHVVIIGEDRDDANLFVSIVLDGVKGYEFLPLSAAHFDIEDMPVPSTDERAIAVIFDADALTPATLDLLRLWTDESRRAIGLVLVGSTTLAYTLALPESRPFAGLIHTRVVLSRPPTPHELKRSDARRSSGARLVLAGAVALCLGMALAVQGVAQAPWLAALNDAAVGSVTWLQTQLSHAPR